MCQAISRGRICLRGRLTHKRHRGPGAGPRSPVTRQKTLKQACSQAYPESAVYVQDSVGSRNSAIHNAYHSSLRPSSVSEPRYPLLKVVLCHCAAQASHKRAPTERDTERCQTESSTDNHHRAEQSLPHGMLPVESPSEGGARAHPSTRGPISGRSREL